MVSLPFGLAYDTTGNHLFVADRDANRVLVFSGSSLANGMNAAYVLGQSSFTGSTLATTQAGMKVPRSLAFDSTNGRLFVPEINNDRLSDLQSCQRHHQRHARRRRSRTVR